MSSQGMELLRAIKQSAANVGPQLLLTIPTLSTYFLRPVPTKSISLNPRDIACLTDWRNRHKQAFLTEFVATTARTEKWLTEVVHNDYSRILFMLVDTNDHPIGYMGLGHINWAEGYGEADAVVRGNPSDKGIMTAGLDALISWAKHQLGLKNIGVRVLSDNPAILFYQRLGFVETKRVALIKRESTQQLDWVEDETFQKPSRYLVYHILRK